jgi:hypothetical protein
MPAEASPAVVIRFTARDTRKQPFRIRPVFVVPECAIEWPPLAPTDSPGRTPRAPNQGVWWREGQLGAAGPDVRRRTATFIRLAIDRAQLLGI